MPSWERLEDFLDLNDFAVEVIPTGCSPFNAIFDNPTMNSETGEYDMNSEQPRVTCKSSDAQGLKKFDTMTVDGVAYVLNADPHHDGTGMCMLDLMPDL